MSEIKMEMQWRKIKKNLVLRNTEKNLHISTSKTLEMWLVK